MAKTFSISELKTHTVEDVLKDYVSRMKDGEAVILGDVIDELNLNMSSAYGAAKKAKICFSAFIPGQRGSTVTMLANPNTIKQWEEAKAKISAPPKRSRSTS